MTFIFLSTLSFIFLSAFQTVAFVKSSEQDFFLEKDGVSKGLTWLISADLFFY